MIKISKKQLRSLILTLIAAIILILNQSDFFKYDDASVTDNQGEVEDSNNMSRVLVSRVVDGDTLKVKTDGKEDTVRLIGINTPESVDPRTVVECFSKEASAQMVELVEGKEVLVVSDPTQGKRDKYNRVLAYVYLKDGTMVNQKMIEDGFAFEYTYNIPYEFQIEFKESERVARENGLGLWDKSVCDYYSNTKKTSN